MSDQELVDGSVVRLTPLVGQQRHESGVSKTNIRLESGTTGETTTVGIPLVLVVPSELSVATWQDLLADEDRVEFVTEIDGRIAIVLAAGDYTIHCTPVGLDSTPTNTPTVFPDLDDDPDINPAAPGDIKLVGENFHSKTVTLTLENIGDVHKNISEARINFYHGSTGNIPTQASLRLAGGADVAVLDVGETFKTLDPVLLLPAEDSEDIELVFDGNTNNHDWFVLTLVFDSGERGTYFVALR